MFIKDKLKELKLTQVDLLMELRKRGYPKLGTGNLNRYINGIEVTPQAKAVLELSEKILDEWGEKDA